MLNQYPLWKNLAILLVFILACLFASANMFAPDPAVQISGVSSSLTMNQSTLKRVTKALDEQGVEYFGEVLSDKNILIRLADLDTQLAAKEVIKNALSDDYVVALNMASTTPDWLSGLGAKPMKLGLDLSGGVHFLMQVNTDEVIKNRAKSVPDSIKRLLRNEDIRYQLVNLTADNELVARFKTEELRNSAFSIVREQASEFLVRSFDESDGFYIRGQMTEQSIREIEDYAVEQNLTTLRNRVNELGVSEPIVQRQGRTRIVVELPGVQDTAEAKRILGKNANLEFRLEAEQSASASSKERFEYRSDDQQRIYGSETLERRVVITGTSVSSAVASFDSQTSLPQVNIQLDSDGGAKMFRNTVNNVGRRLGVLFIEYKTITKDSRGNLLEKPEQRIERKIISLATVQSPLNADFRITGLDSPAEASELALLLRAGALAAPMTFVQESTIGPSLGAENIALGVASVQLGLALVVLFMLIYYRWFGLAANLALTYNLILIVAVMSQFGATLTLPGIAGIVLTVGMAVDANVLIFSRIKEELKSGMSPQMAINAGFDRAFVTILDANITTFIVAIILYGIGTGPVKGFAVTLAIGILTSMFTAILGTRSLVNLMYGGKPLKTLKL